MVSYSGFSRASENQEDKNGKTGRGKIIEKLAYLFLEAGKFHSATCKLEKQESMAEHRAKDSGKPVL